MTIILMILLFILIDTSVYLYYSKAVKLLVADADKRAIDKIRKDWSLLSSGITDPELERQFLQVLGKMYGTFIIKNHDYGTMNMAMGGVQGIVLRMADKMARIWNLTGLSGKKSALVKDEATADTFLDISNYGIAGYLLLQGKWPKSSISQVFGNDAIKAVLAEMYSVLGDEDRQDFLSYIIALDIADEINATVNIS